MTSNMDFSGRRLGPYDLMDEIGRGGMATVYRARQRSINRIVAVKVLPPVLMHDPAFYERFTREVDIISHLEHPHILPIYDYGEAEGIPYIAMRYLAGGSMAQVIRRGLPDFAWLIKPLDQIALALDYAHQQGIIHRDLKPGNILLDERNNAYLTDFGIARVLDSSLTGSAIIGTPAYMSPEQANAAPLDSRSDLYSFGIVLYELLTGREPYEAETPVALLLKHLNEPVPPVREFRPEAPAGVDLVIQRATAKHPADRYASLSEMTDAYAAAVRGFAPGTPTPLTASPAPGNTRPRLTPLPAPDPVTVTPVVVKTRPVSADAPAPPARRRSGIALTVAAGLLAVVVIALLAIGTLGPVAPVYVTPTPQAVTAPTLYPGGMAFALDGTSLTVPTGWAFSDQSSAAALRVVWERDAGATIALMREAGDLAADFHARLDAFEAVHFPAAVWTRLDEAAAPDGTVRRSYRLAEATGAQEPGQSDVFFRDSASGLVALELYAADRWGNSLVPVYQQVLDSLRAENDGPQP